MNKREVNVLHQELESYREMGIPLYLNGKKSTPKRIEKAYRIAEEGVYMRDYIQDDTGKLKGLSFDFVREEEWGKKYKEKIKSEKNMKSWRNWWRREKIWYNNCTYVL